MFMEKIKNFYKKISESCFLVILLFFGIANSLTFSFNELRLYTNTGFVYRGIILVFFVLFVVPVLLINFMKFKKSTFFIAIFYLLINSVIMIVSPLIYTVKISLINYFLGFIQSFVNLICIYLIYYFIKFSTIGKKELNFVYWVLIIFVLFLSLFSYIFEFDSLINTFKPITDECKLCAWNADVTSIYQSKTVYGFMLMTATIFSILYAILQKKYLHFAFSLFFTINIVISRSKTSLLTIIIFCLILFFYFLIKLKAKLFKKWYLWVIGLSIIVTLGILTILRVNIFFERIYYFIGNSILKDGIVVLNDRFERWHNIFKEIKKPITILFGLGERVNYPILKSLIGYVATDSGYLYIYVAGGFFYFSVCCLIIAFLIKTITKEKCFISLGLVICLLINFFFEGNFIVGIAYNQILPFIIIVFSFNMEKFFMDEHQTSLFDKTSSV